MPHDPTPTQLERQSRSQPDERDRRIGTPEGWGGGGEVSARGPLAVEVERRDPLQPLADLRQLDCRRGAGLGHRPQAAAGNLVGAAAGFLCRPHRAQVEQGIF